MPPSQATPPGPATGRNPAAYATSTTSTVDTALRTIDSTTCPVSAAAGRIGSERNRFMSPLVMSLATPTAVVDAP